MNWWFTHRNSLRPRESHDSRLSSGSSRSSRSGASILSRNTLQSQEDKGKVLFGACHLKHYCLWDRTYSRSNFSIRARASRATSHTLKKDDKANVHIIADIGRLPLKRSMLQSPPWIQVHRGHQGFQTHRWLPEVPLGQGNHAHQGRPVKRERQEESDKNNIVSQLICYSCRNACFTDIATSSSITTGETTTTRGTLMMRQAQQYSKTLLLVPKLQG